MSLPSRIEYRVPEETARVAWEIFPEGHLYMQWYETFGTLFEDRDFAALFSAEGQPALSPMRLCLVLLLQFAEGLSDRQAAEAVRTRIDWKYLLCLELTDTGFHYSVLSEFRGRLVKNGAEGQIFNRVLELCRAKGLIRKRGLQRSDSTEVVAAIRTLNRLELVGETLRAALNALAVAAPEWTREHTTSEWVDRYGPHSCQVKEMRCYAYMIFDNTKAEHLMSMVNQIAKAMQVVLGEWADEKACDIGFVQRQRKVSGSSFVQSLVFGWLANGASRMEELSQSSSNVGVSISRQGLHQRFTPEAAQFLKAVLCKSIEQVIGTQTPPDPLLERFAGVYVIDTTIISLPDALLEYWGGCNGSEIKIGVCWELLSGALVAVELLDGRVHDQHSGLQTLPVPPGAVRLADLGFFKLSELQRLSDEQAGWVTRYKGKTQLYDGEGQAIDLLQVLLATGDEIVEFPVEVGTTQRVRARLVAQRVPEEQVQQRREQLSRWESRKQKTASPERWALLAWSIYLTNLDATRASGAEIMLMARVRWQIELLFKLWKSTVDIDDWRTQNPTRILCELYTKLIACIIQHWLLLVGGIHALDKSMTQATIPIQHYAWTLAYSLMRHDLLIDLITHIGRILGDTCRISTSRSSMPTYQRIQHLCA